MFTSERATDVVDKDDVRDADNQTENTEREVQRIDFADVELDADVVRARKLWTTTFRDENRRFGRETSEDEIRQVERVVRELELQGRGVPLGGEAAVVGFDSVAMKIERGKIVRFGIGQTVIVVTCFVIDAVFGRVVVARNLGPQAITYGADDRDSNSVRTGDGDSEKKHEEPTFGFTRCFDFSESNNRVATGRCGVPSDGTD